MVGGSIAAGVQASIGNVVAGSAFATLQSVGAAGFAASTVAATTATTAAAGVALGAAIPGNNNSVGDNEDNDNVSNDTDSGFDTAFGLNQTVVGSEESLFDRLLCVSRVNTQKIMRRNSFWSLLVLLLTFVNQNFSFKWLFSFAEIIHSRKKQIMTKSISREKPRPLSLHQLYSFIQIDRAIYRLKIPTYSNRYFLNNIEDNIKSS